MPLKAGNYPVINPTFLYDGQPSGQVIRTNISRETVLVDQSAALTTQVMLGVTIPLFSGDVISKLGFSLGHTAAVSPTNSWVALYDTSATPALLAQSADQTSTAIAADALYELSLATSVQITKTGLYIAALMVKATVPSIWCKTFAANSYLNTAGITGQKPYAQTSGSSLTTTAPGTWATPTTVLNVPYVTAR